MFRRRLQAGDRTLLINTVLIAFFLLALFLILNHLPLWHTDIWAHLKFGQWINSNGHLPEREPFSPWSETKPYLPMAWLSQVILGWVYDWGAGVPVPSIGAEGVRPGGVDALRFLAAALVAFRFLLLYLAYRRYTLSSSLAMIGIIFCLSLSFTHIDVFRPQVFGELCLAAMLFATCKPLPSKLASWLVPLLLAIWANLHGSFLNGLLVLLGVMAGRFFQEIRERSEGTGGGGQGFGRQLFHSPPMRRLFRMFYLSIIAIGFLNPLWSFRWYAETWSFAGNPNVATMDEWQRLDWLSPSGWAFAGSLMVVFGTHWLARWRGKQGINFGHWLLVLCFGLQVVFYQRMLPWWAMLAPYVCLAAWKRIVESCATEIRLPSLGNAISTAAESPWHSSPKLAPKKRWMSWAVVILALWVAFSWSTLGTLILQKQATPLDQSLHPGTPRLLVQAMLQPDSPAVPKELTDWLRTSHGPIFCSETLGDYLLFTSPRPPIIYSHVQLFPFEHWQRCLAVKNGDAGWADLLRTWNANIVLVEAELHPRLCTLIRADKKWKVIVDEAGKTSKRDPKTRHFLAVKNNQ